MCTPGVAAPAAMIPLGPATGLPGIDAPVAMIPLRPTIARPSVDVTIPIGPAMGRVDAPTAAIPVGPTLGLSGSASAASLRHLSTAGRMTLTAGSPIIDVARRPGTSERAA